MSRIADQAQRVAQIQMDDSDPWAAMALSWLLKHDYVRVETVEP